VFVTRRLRATRATLSAAVSIAQIPPPPNTPPPALLLVAPRVFRTDRARGSFDSAEGEERQFRSDLERANERAIAEVKKNRFIF
jgi:hypothetical protein